MYQQVLDPVADSLAWSAVVAALPLLLLFVLLGALKMTAWVASLISLAVSIVIAVVVYGMPIGQTLLAGTEGAAFGFFPILWIVINAIWVYQMTVETGHFDVLRRSFSQVSDDQRIQAIIIAFSFGALIEALAGFGTPVAVTSVMLMALGFKPLKAAVLALVANTAPVAFGAMATPIITLGKVTELPVDTLGAMVGRQTPILALLVPLALVAIVDGWRGIRETWPAAVVCGVVFALAQYATSNFLSVPLADVVASLLSAAAVVVLVRVWRPRHAYTEQPAAVAGGAADEPSADFAQRVENADGRHDSRADVIQAYAPYAIIIAVFVVCQISAVKSLLDKATFAFNWPGLDVVDPDGESLSLTKFSLNLLTTPGTQMLVAGILTMVALKLSAPRALKAYGVDTASAPLGDRHGHDGAGTRLRDEPVRSDDHPRHLDGRGGWGIRAAVPHPRLARRRRHRLRHLCQFPLRRTTGDRGEPGRAVRRPDGRVEQLRRRARQDDLAAEPRHRGSGGGPRRQGGRHLPPGRAVEPGLPLPDVHPLGVAGLPGVVVDGPVMRARD